MSAPIALLWKDVEGKYLGMNSQALEMFGFTAEQILGKTDHDLFPEELADYYRKVDKRVMASKKSEYFLEKAKDKTNKIIEVFVGKKPLLDQDRNVVGIVLFSHSTNEIPH